MINWGHYSHLDAIGRQLLDRFEGLETSAYALSYSGCVPISGLNRADMDSGFQCVEYNEAVRNYARANGVKTIVLVGRFPLYLLGNRYDNGEGGIEKGNPVPVDLDNNLNSLETNDNVARIERVLARYRSDIEQLTREFNVVIFTPIPEVGWDVPAYYAKQLMFNRNDTTSHISISHSYRNYLERTRQFFDMIKAIKNNNLYIYDVSKLFCFESNERCLANINDNLLYRDDDHLSSYAANLVADDFIKFYLEQIGNATVNE